MSAVENFGGIDNELTDYKKAKVVVVPVPYEGTVSYGHGTSHGPQAILEASNNMELYDEELKKSTCEIGISTLKALDVANDKPDIMVYKVSASIKKIINDNKFPIVLGGEHSISSGPVKALKEKYPNLSVLQLDAHSDLRDSYDGTKYSHAAVMKRIVELGCKIVPVGIRSLSEKEPAVIEKNNIPVFWAHEIHDKQDWHEKAIKVLSDNVYVTIDLDVFDPAVMAATGTPEPGGLGWYDVVGFLRKVFAEKNVVGMDVVELAPQKGMHACDFLAAKLVYRLLGYKFS